MVTHFYMLDIYRVNGKAIWCLIYKEDVSKFSSKDFR